MQEREIPGSVYCNETKNKIMDEATKQFALKGFCAVTMRDIAKAVGINMSSIYYHYESKELLMEDILSRFEKGYRNYIDWQFDANSKVDSLDEFMDNLFNKEFLEVHDPMGHFGMSIALKEQHEFESARNRVFNLFHDYSIQKLKESFDRLIEKGIIPPSDTKTIARLFTYCVLTGNDLRIHELSGRKPPVDCVEMYINVKAFIMNALIKGI